MNELEKMVHIVDDLMIDIKKFRKQLFEISEMLERRGFNDY